MSVVIKIKKKKKKKLGTQGFRELENITKMYGKLEVK